MTAFVLYKFKGEVFDYDFEKQTRDYKVHRTRFPFGRMSQEKAGLTIDPEKCIACGALKRSVPLVPSSLVLNTRLIQPVAMNVALAILPSLSIPLSQNRL